MPPRYGKRKLEEFDPTKSDSDDENYDERTERPSKSRPSRSRQKGSGKKRKRVAYGSDESDALDSDGDEGEESFEAESAREEETIEVDERTGRPKRLTTKRTVKYEEGSDSESDEIADSPESEQPPPKRQKKSQVIKLKINTARVTPGAGGRTTRAGSAPRGRRGASSEPLSAGTRRSSRLHHDEQETMIALTDSGRHAQIIRPGTHSPEQLSPPRPTRGGKGIRAPETSAILEEEESTQSALANQMPEGDADHVSASNGTTPKAQDDVSVVADSDEDRVLKDMRPEDEVAVSEAPEETLTGAVASPVSTLRDPVETQLVPEENDDEDDDEDGPVSRRRKSKMKDTAEEPQDRHSRSLRRRTKGGKDQSSDFEFNPEEGEEEELLSSGGSEASPRKDSQRHEEEDDESSNAQRASHTRKRKFRATSSAQLGGSGSEEHDSEVAEELAEELQELRSSRPRRAPPRSEIVYDAAPKLRNRKKTVDYRIMRPELLTVEDVEAAPAVTPSRRRGGGGGGSWQRSLFSTFGPFGGAGGPPPVLGGPGGVGATAGVDSDSSDEERGQRASGFGGAVGMTPTSAVAPGLFPTPQAHGTDPQQGPSGTPANLGKVKDRKALADADPLGVDQNVNFDSVGGLQDHINQLKEMVSLPLLYPEIFQRFHVTPPRGVLFHGPPGTGKTLLARALAASVSSEGRKITFYMRKGADALSKWVGEAERQLRLLFEEARSNQPSIIFFDEIDGLAPVRSSKQEQIHASIVSTLLALMDGMDGRGQVIVIGATNRPDSVDPALRRPGRFDREFYFPLPTIQARRSILDIHTKGWEPGLSSSFKDQLAELTKGYGGADLRALCTEAALNAVQRRYPQIYTSNEKLKIDPTSIDITAKDFMISIKKLVPSSERSTSSGAAPLPSPIEPLLRLPLADVKNLLKDILPQRKHLTALEEAQFEDSNDSDGGFQRERIQQEFETSRIFRPRLLIRGMHGMGQQYVAAALLNHLEGVHVQSFDLPTLLSDSTRSMEAAVVQLFTEVRRHKPSVIFIPNVDSWYKAVGSTVISTFLGLLRGLAPTDPVLVLGVLESEPQEIDRSMLRDLFGFSKKNQYELTRPNRSSRYEYFERAAGYIRKAPEDFPNPAVRKRRKLEHLEVAPPPPPPAPPSKEARQAQKKQDRQTLNLLKIRIQPVMDQIKIRYRKFRSGIIEADQIRYIIDEQDPDLVIANPTAGFRPFEKATDREGVPGLLEVSSGKFYYNLDIVVVEERLSNGYYKRPKDFLDDIRTLAKDARSFGDRDRTLKANEMLANVEVDMANLEQDPVLADCEHVALREMRRVKEKSQKRADAINTEGQTAASIAVSAGADGDTSEQVSSGPVHLGEPVPQGSAMAAVAPSRPSDHSSMSNGLSAGPGNLDDPSGHHALSNGSSVPSRKDEDIEMLGTGNSRPTTQGETEAQAVAPSQTSPPIQPDWGLPPSQRDQSTPLHPSGAQTQRSQKSILTAMPPGSQLDEFVNDASTTSSGKKTSESNRSSERWNTQSSSGAGGSGKKDIPDFANQQRVRGDSQLPDTQGTFSATNYKRGGFLTIDTEVASSQGSGGRGSQSQPPSRQGSQRPVPPSSALSRPPQSASIQSLLNNSSAPANSPHPEFVVDHPFVDGLHVQFTERSSGCAVEQLEQINTALMDCIWQHRGEHNRTFVGKQVMEIFNEVVSDVEAMQEILPASLGSR
ncbi:MAG: hypothetical protein M1833_004988 [Piccolia ochrophora]|nr:MAG: hypothetical protein M1833_004988 [Piccolia ochrophora]